MQPGDLAVADTTLHFGPHTEGYTSAHAGQLVGTLFNQDAAQHIQKQTLQKKSGKAPADRSIQAAADSHGSAVAARNASRVLQSLTSQQREQLLCKIADKLLAQEEEILRENQADCEVGSCIHQVDTQGAYRLCLGGGLKGSQAVCEAGSCILWVWDWVPWCCA